MTMFLPNPGLRPTGVEAGEYLEVTRMADEVPPSPLAIEEVPGVPRPDQPIACATRTGRAARAKEGS